MLTSVLKGGIVEVAVEGINLDLRIGPEAEGEGKERLGYWADKPLLLLTIERKMEGPTNAFMRTNYVFSTHFKQ